MVSALAVSLAVLLLANLIAGAYFYRRYIYQPKKKLVAQISGGRIPDQFLPQELQEEEEAAVPMVGRSFARKPEPLKWQERQTAIAEHFSKHPELLAAWQERRNKRQIPRDAGIGI